MLVTYAPVPYLPHVSVVRLVPESLNKKQMALRYEGFTQCAEFRLKNHLASGKEKILGKIERRGNLELFVGRKWFCAVGVEVLSRRR